jgi:5-methylthioribose kinase
MLDEDQQTAFDLAKDGHNLVVIVQGGCEKTFLIKQIVNYLRSKGKTVTITFGTFVSGNRIWCHIRVIVHSRLPLIRNPKL